MCQEEKRNWKRIIKEDKERCWREFVNDLEENVGSRKKQLYGLVKKRQNKNEIAALIKNKDGKDMVKKNNNKDRWREYYHDLVNVYWGSPMGNIMEKFSLNFSLKYVTIKIFWFILINRMRILLLQILHSYSTYNNWI